MIDKQLLSKIEKLEKQYPIIDIDKAKEQINILIEWLEDYLGYSIRNRIDFSSLNYTNIDKLERAVFEKLTIEELKMLVYEISED